MNIYKGTAASLMSLIIASGLIQSQDVKAAENNKQLNIKQDVYEHKLEKNEMDSFLTNNGFDQSSGMLNALQKAKQYSNNDLSMGLVKNPKDSYESAIGVVYNKGVTGGTGFVIGDHTIITNTHIVRKDAIKKDRSQFKDHPEKIYETANPENITFRPARVNDSMPFGTYEIKDAKAIKGLDITILHTKEKINPKVNRLKLASEKTIRSMKQGDKLHGIGYPDKKLIPKKYDIPIENWTMTRFDGYYLQPAYSIDPQFYTKMIIRKGSSGSPILNERNEVVGVNSNGFNITNKATWQAAPEEMAFVQSLVGKQRSDIEKLIY